MLYCFQLYIAVLDKQKPKANAATLHIFLFAWQSFCCVEGACRDFRTLVSTVGILPSLNLNPRMVPATGYNRCQPKQKEFTLLFLETIVQQKKKK